MDLKDWKNILEQEQEDVLVEEKPTEKRSLILHNDEVHTFDYVIEALIEVCEHDTIQAEQCTYLVHYKGKCDVKSGSFEELKPYKDELIRRELEATID